MRFNLKFKLLICCFNRTRDEICGNGDVLSSPALNYNLRDLEKSVELVKEGKEGQELPQEEDTPAPEKEKDEVTDAQSSQSESYNEQTFCVGDFVYVTPTHLDGSSLDASTTGAAGAKPNIANIQKLWTAPDGTKWFEGIWFFRPDQTYHMATRKFLQKASSHYIYDDCNL